MKRIALVALSATAAMAQVPATTTTAVAAPVAATPVSYNTEASAPLAPIHDDLIMGNPAIPGSIGYLLVTPSDYYGERKAAFQWNGGNTAHFDGTGLAVVDQFFAGFAAAGAQGQLAGGYIAPAFGAGLRMNFDKRGFAADVGPTEEYDSTYAPTSFGLFGSAPLGDFTAYASLDWGTPADYGTLTTRSAAGSNTTASRSDELAIGFGLVTPANGDNGLSWTAEIDLARSKTRASGEDDDDAEVLYSIEQTGSIGTTFSAERHILAVGLNEMIGYYNSKSAPDWGYTVELQPTLSTILPVFERWTLKGGTGLALAYNRADYLAGDDEVVFSRLWSATPVAIVGIRYERGRWAAEASVDNGFLNRGPNFVSGASGNLFGSFAVTANFK
ncbi:MAG TPA: hypothetical protein PK208_11005 [Fibrobacteria bacterium]|nr:hypothetical protein [Fibrobacteria bacterium]